MTFFCGSKMGRTTAEVMCVFAQCTEALHEFYQLPLQNNLKISFFDSMNSAFSLTEHEILATTEVSERLPLASLGPGSQWEPKHLFPSLFLSWTEMAALIMIFVSQPSGTFYTCLCIFRELEQHASSLQHYLLWIPSCHQRCGHQWK